MTILRIGSLAMLALGTLLAASPADGQRGSYRGGGTPRARGPAYRVPSAPRAPRARSAPGAPGSPRVRAAPPPRAPRARAAPGARNSRGRLKRSPSAKREFMKSTGHPRGWPGHVVDHIVPLACGGRDSPSNMQWQTTAEAKAKDKVERRGC